MNERPEQFYKEFDCFLSELLKERGRRRVLSGVWAAASIDILGLRKMNALIPTLAVFGVVLLPAAPLISVGLLGIGMASKAYKVAFNNKKSVLARLEKAKHLFQSLSQLVERGNPDAKEEIDRLFDDLVMDRDFIS